MKTIRSYLNSKKQILAATALLTTVGSAYAAVPADVSDAFDDIGTDAATIGGMVLVVVVGIAAFKFLRRAV
ncbi:MAG: major capsid protein [Methylovulum sp.]|nr:major capsid protein [Methylovulum sp.]